MIWTGPGKDAKALDTVRRAHWNTLRAAGDAKIARRFKGARWALLRNPEDLSDTQAETLDSIQPHRQRTLAGLQGQRGTPRHLRR